MTRYTRTTEILLLSDAFIRPAFTTAYPMSMITNSFTISCMSNKLICMDPTSFTLLFRGSIIALPMFPSIIFRKTGESHLPGAPGIQPPEAPGIQPPEAPEIQPPEAPGLSLRQKPENPLHVVLQHRVRRGIQLMPRCRDHHIFARNDPVLLYFLCKTLQRIK